LPEVNNTKYQFETHKDSGTVAIFICAVHGENGELAPYEYILFWFKVLKFSI